LTVTTIARGEVPPTAPLDPPVSPLMRLLPVLWLAALLAGLYAMSAVRRVPQLRRYAAIVPLALLLISGAVLAGCAGGKTGTAAGTSQLSITATSGSMSQTTPANSVALTVQ
jgi:formate hydrogenlyase subunit 4